MHKNHTLSREVETGLLSDIVKSEECVQGQIQRICRDGKLRRTHINNFLLLESHFTNDLTLASGRPPVEKSVRKNTGSVPIQFS